MELLGDLAAEATFPVFAVHPHHWSGIAFVGDTERLQGRLAEVMLVYQDRTGTRGFAVDSMDPGSGADDDLTRFVARFNPRFAMKRVKRRRKNPAFPPDAFSTLRIEVNLLGEPRSLDLLTHHEIPLQVAPLHLQHAGKQADVWVLGWDVKLQDLLPLVVPVDVHIANAFRPEPEPEEGDPPWTG